MSECVYSNLGSLRDGKVALCLIHQNSSVGEQLGGTIQDLR
jgi:hypothetical protein